MQRSEFDNVFAGNPAKFANLDGLKSANNPNALMGLLAKAQAKEHTKEDVEVAREAIKANEVEIPAETRLAMDLVISLERGKGKSERAIRRIIQKKFNITVI